MGLKHLMIFILMVLSGVFYYGITGEVVGGMEEVVVLRVIDGDSLELDGGQKVRLLGINTPEKSMSFYEVASGFVRDLVEGESVEIESYGFDKYGRMLGYVFVDGVNLNREILERGFGTLYYYDKDIYYDELKRAEEFARLNEIGIWGKSSNWGCLEIVEFEIVEPERLVLGNVCDVDLDFMFKDDATHIYREVVGGGSILEKEFSHIWNNDGDSIYVYDSEGLLMFYRYD